MEVKNVVKPNKFGSFWLSTDKWTRKHGRGDTCVHLVFALNKCCSLGTGWRNNFNYQMSTEENIFILVSTFIHWYIKSRSNKTDWLVFIENGVQFRSSTRIRRQRHLLLRFGISAATERLGHWLQINVNFTSEYGLICSLNHHYRGDRVVRTVLSRPRFNRRGEWDN